MNRSKKLFNISTLVYVCLVYLFLYLPIFVLVLFSFNSSKLNINFEGFTLKWYGELFSNGPLLEALKNTMIVAFFSTLVSGIIGTIAAVGMYRYSFKGKSVIDSLTFSIPFVVITVRSRLSGFDKSIEEAAMDLGASRLKTFLKVTLPVIWPGVMSGVLLAFTLSLDDVIISFFTTGPQSNTLPLKIFSMVKTGVTPDVNALSTLMLVATFMVVGAAQYIQIRKEKSLNYNND